MNTILLFGAGKSASVLIDFLVKESQQNNWKFIIADADKKQVLAKTNNSPFAEAVALNILDDENRRTLVQRADIVISMMPPSLHILIAKDCVEFGKHLLTASYLDAQIKGLEKEVKDKGLFFLCEMGLDPGIDHMSAMQLFDEIKAEGGEVTSFKSHCGGLVAPESDNNPWHYKISWNPRNVVLAGKAGAVYKFNNEMVKEDYEVLFDADRKVATGNDEVPVLSFYPNRDSMPYIDLYQLHHAETFVRTTLRYPDFMHGWKNIIELKLTDETVQYQTDGKTLQDVFREHLEKNGFGEWLEHNLSNKLAETKALLENLVKIMEAEEKATESGEALPDNFMVVSETGDLKNIEVDEIKTNAAAAMAEKMHEANLIMKQLFFLGLNDNETLVNKGLCSAADILQFALEKKLVLEPGDKDMIVMLHEIEYTTGGSKKSIHSSLIVKGEDHIHTAMAKTVGLPLGITAKLMLQGKLNLTGLHIPVIKEIYEPVLEALKKHDVIFYETRR
ncbi:MAG: saccharopine dehydrogenase NADP-binding domain-containing protein [Bacteroidetes bacterium]|nr:saccharopine dehydrogenase NADP-binding domain-containing protein [Bacteroidota bacterium]